MWHAQKCSLSIGQAAECVFLWRWTVHDAMQWRLHSLQQIAKKSKSLVRSCFESEQATQERKWLLPSLNTPPRWLCAGIFCRRRRSSGWVPLWARKRLRRTSFHGDAADGDKAENGVQMYITTAGGAVCTLAFTSAMGSMLLFSGRPAATGAKLGSWLWFVATKLKPRNSWWVLALGGMPGESGQATTHRQNGRWLSEHVTMWLL